MLLPKEYDSTYSRRFLKKWVQLDNFKKYVKYTVKRIWPQKRYQMGWKSLVDIISIKSPLGAMTAGNNPIDRSKMG